jgi:uncharacterized protein YbaP (TraB family)
MTLLLLGIILQCTVKGKGETLENALIWRVRGDDLPAPSYLFGTVHVMDSNDLSIHPTVIEQLRHARALVFETNLADPDYQKLALHHSFMEHDSLEDLLSDEQFQVLKRFFLEEFEFPIEAVHKMKPFFVASLIGALESKGASRSHEELLMQIAVEDQIMIEGISDPDQEAAILNRISLKEQVGYLFMEMESHQDGTSEALKQEVFQAYERADLDSIHALISESLGQFPQIYHQLFDARNTAWLPAMIRHMQNQSCFFAVGVGHLPGETGLISLLRENGYRVSPVHMDFWFHDR